MKYLLALLALGIGIAAPLGAAPPPTTPPVSGAPAAIPPPLKRLLPVWSVAFSPDGRTLAVGTYQAIQLWDIGTKSTLRRLPGHAGPVRCLAWSPDGTRLAGGGGKPGELGEVKVWDTSGDLHAASNAPPTTLQEHKDVVESVAFAPAGDVVLSASEDEKVLATEVGTRKVLRAMTDHTNRVISVATNGKYIATGSLDKSVKIWSAADYLPLANLDSNNGQVYAVAFLPNDQLVAAGEDGNVRVYRLSATQSGKIAGVGGQVIRTINGNRTPVLAVAASAKGDLLVYGGADKTVNVVDPRNGGRKYTLKECPDAVYAVAISPDGSTIAAGCRDGRVRLWGTADGKLIAEL
jgi:hypothetical protein